MYDTPASMLDLCIDYLCSNMRSLCEAQPTDLDDNATAPLIEAGVSFPGNISEQILETLSERDQLTDNTMSFFRPSITRLQHVNINNAPLTRRGLKMLKHHKISELKVTGLKNITVNDLIGCLGEWTLDNLRMLNVSCSRFINDTNLCVVVSLSKLRSLVALNVSNTDFDTHGLEIITDDLPNLEILDISETSVHDISSLKRCKNKLKSLCMYNVRMISSDDVVSVLLELQSLRLLDISDDFNVQDFVHLEQNKFIVADLLSHAGCLPMVTSLDISGKEDVTEKCLTQFVVDHPNLRFLGLALTDTGTAPILTDRHYPQFQGHITVTGNANEAQIVECLKRYTTRSTYIHKSLFNLFTHTMSAVECRHDIIHLIWTVMKEHPKQLGVQMAATACLYNLTKGTLSHQLHPTVLHGIVAVTLNAMENFPRHQQLQKNALLTLCTDHILQDLLFERYRCARLVMECLCQFDDQSLTRMSVAICSILAAKITTEQTAKVGANPRYMKKMLGLVRDRISNGVVDITLKFTLSALWNLTDECPPTCKMFLHEHGLELFMRILEHVEPSSSEERVPVETKVLGLLNNISEVASLRSYLIREDFMMVIVRLLQSEHIDVSYFAGGIVAYLTSDREQLWTLSGTTRESLLDQLRSVVSNWEIPEGEMVAYRSFNPFFPLLQQEEITSAQLWAVWAIQHVCIKNPELYCRKLYDEKGAAVLMSLLTNCADADVALITRDILRLLVENVKEFEFVFEPFDEPITESLSELLDDPIDGSIFDSIDEDNTETTCQTIDDPNIETHTETTDEHNLCIGASSDMKMEPNIVTNSGPIEERSIGMTESIIDDPNTETLNGGGNN